MQPATAVELAGRGHQLYRKHTQPIYAHRPEDDVGPA